MSISPPDPTSVIKHIGSGKYSDVFLVTNGRNNMAMKISYYRDETVCKFVELVKAGDLAGALRIKLTDSISVSNAFSKFTRTVLDDVSPHFVLTYLDADCKSFVEKIPLVTPQRMSDLTPFQKRYNNVSFMEAFSCDMTKFLHRSKYDERTLRMLMFQVLYTIAAMQRSLPGWRHNDLSTNNVLVKKTRKSTSSSYHVDGVTFYTDTPTFVALNDYDFVHVPGHPRMQNQRVTGGKYRVNAEPNASYDVHFFLKSVLRCIAKKPRSEFAKTVRFLKDVGLRDDDRQDEEIPSLAPDKVIMHQYFAPLRKKIEVTNAYAIPKP